MIQSSFPNHDANMVAVASNDVSITQHATQTDLVSHFSLLFVHMPVSSALVPHDWFSQ
jgi:hypothetical protein